MINSTIYFRQPGPEQVAPTPEDADDESASDIEVCRDDDDGSSNSSSDSSSNSSTSTSNSSSTRSSSTSTSNSSSNSSSKHADKASEDDTSREAIAESNNTVKFRDTRRSNHHGCSSVNISSSADHRKVNHTTNNSDDDDAMSVDSDDGDRHTGTIRPPTAMITRSKASNEAQAKDTGRPSEEKQRARKSTPSDIAAFVDSTNDTGKTTSLVEAQAKTTGPSKAKQRARKSTMDEARASRRDDNSNTTNRRSVGRPPASLRVPTTPRTSSESALPRAETMDSKAGIPALGAVAGVVSASEMEAPAGEDGYATELAPTVKATAADSTPENSIVRLAVASARGNGKEQGGRECGGRDPQKTRRHLAVTGANQTATPAPAEARKPQPSTPPAPGSREFSALVPGAMMPATASRSAHLPYRSNDANGAEGGALPKRGRGRPRKVATPFRQTTTTGTAPAPASVSSVASHNGAKEPYAATMRRGGRSRKVAPPKKISGARRAEGEDRLLEDEAAIPAKSRDGGGENGDNLHPATASPANGAKMSEGASRSKPTEGETEPALEASKPCRPRGRPRKTTPLPAAAMAMALVTVAPATSRADRGDTGEDRRWDTRSEDGKSATSRKKGSAGGSISRGRTNRAETTPRQTSSTMKKRPGGGSTIVKKGGGGGGGGKRGKGPGGIEVTGDGGGVTASTVFGVTRQKATMIEIRWEVDVQTVGRKTEKVRCNGVQHG